MVTGKWSFLLDCPVSLRRIKQNRKQLFNVVKLTIHRKANVLQFICFFCCLRLLKNSIRSVGMKIFFRATNCFVVKCSRRLYNVSHSTITQLLHLFESPKNVLKTKQWLSHQENCSGVNRNDSLFYCGWV